MLAYFANAAKTPLSGTVQSERTCCCFAVVYSLFSAVISYVCLFNYCHFTAIMQHNLH